MDIMELLVLIFCVIPAIVSPITISPNGNSPEIKMIGGMMVDVQQGFVPMKPTTTIAPEAITKSNYEKSRKLNLNATKLSINERYRRLIPYMTFYYANDLSTPTTESFVKNIEVEKAEIVEAPHLERQPKKIIYPPYRNIPRYQGNRLTHYNIASANPTKVYKDIVPHNYQAPATVPQNYNPYLAERNLEGHDFRRLVHKPSSIKFPSAAPFAAPTRKPYLNFHNDEDSANIQYYLNDKEESPRYKLVPYEQTPPVKVENYDEDLYDIPPKVPVPVYVPKEQQVYVKPRPQRPQYSYDNVFYQQPFARKPPAIVSENYYEKSRPQQHELAKPIIESGFKPILGSPVIATEAPAYSSTISEQNPRYESERHNNVQVIETESQQPTPPNHRPNYYQYVVDEPAYKPPVSNQITLSDLINSLQLNKSIPKPITRDNVGSSIRTLLSVLNALKAAPHQNDVDPLVLSTPKPFVAQKEIVPELKPVIQPTESPHPNDVEFNQEPYLAPVNPPSQHIDDFSPEGGTSQRFPLQITSDDEGGTPGRPGVDYPVLTTIPPTRFDCKTQRYKGFFADPETRCQVWHYCDLNGGQASFLCPNGTIFSQAGLTCDWWFNVRCASTTQLYVLNESLYKYILPHSPKFPEDYSGPLVDKYLTLKFKEMEEQFRKNKHKANEKVDSDDEEDEEEEKSTEDSTKEEPSDPEESHMSSVSEASVVVQSPGNSGNVERLQD